MTAPWRCGACDSPGGPGCDCNAEPDYEAQRDAREADLWPPPGSRGQ